MPDSSDIREADPVDPDIRRFVREISAGFAGHPGFESAPYPQARAIAEQVRRPWREGGPVMAQTLDLTSPGCARLRIHYPKAQAPEAQAPEAQALSPALVYLHGGGWTIFSIDTHDRLMREYAKRSGLVVVGIDYPLSPEAKYPTALNEIVETVRWLARDGAALGIDSRRLYIGGDSAGGNLSLATALKLRDESEGDLVKGLLLNYGAFTDACSDEAAQRYGGEDFMLGADEMRVYWANYLRTTADAAEPYACPMRASLAGLPPVFLVVAECDVLAEQSHAMAARLKDAGVAATMEVYRGATHSFLEAVSISPLADKAIADASAWLAGRAAADAGGSA
ncbi:MAG TPA: alpha/beta hydrolase [Caulobacteraceae bacterium]|jgi:acetyl esterase|nr:alpha/beta hydrolase [Caulobacteraceae bacterium]